MILLSKWSKIKLNWMTTVMVYGLKIIGLAPLSHRIIKLRLNSGNTCTVRGFCFSKIGTAYNILLLIIHQVITGLMLWVVVTSLDPSRVIITVSNSFCGLALSVNIISSTLQQTKAVSVMNRLLEVDLLLSDIEKHRLSNKRIVRSFFLHSMFNGLLCASHIVWVVLIGSSDWIFAVKLWMKVSNYLIYWFIIEYSIVLGVLFNEVERVNENLLKLKELPIDLSRKQFINNHLAVVCSLSSDSRLATIKLLRTIRTTLCELSKDVDKFYSFPILVSIGYFCFQSVENISYFMSNDKFGNEFSLSSLLLYLFWIGLLLAEFIYSTILLAFNATKISKEAELTGLIVHKLLTTATRQEVKLELEQFSLQLLHEHFRFMACGLFSLECEMLHSISGAAVTYVIIWKSIYDSQQN